MPITALVHRTSMQTTTLRTPLGAPTTPEEAQAAIRFLPDDPRDFDQVLIQTFERSRRDLELMAAFDRWMPGQLDPSSYVPGDVPAMRATMSVTDLQIAGAIREISTVRERKTERTAEMAELAPMHFVEPMLVYRAAPFFVAGELALAAGASDRPPAELVEDVRLPFPSVWIVFGHDLELPAEMSWPPHTSFEVHPLLEALAGPLIGAWKRNIAGALHDRGGVICGVVVFAGKGGVGLADEILWTVAANPDPDMPPPRHLDRQRGTVVGARSRALLSPVVENLALLVATSPWTDTPPTVPGIGEPGTGRWHRSLQRAKARRLLDAGAGSGVRIVRVAHHAGVGQRSEPAGSQEAHRQMPPHARRGHWRRSRVATRDAAGRLVGNVHGTHGTDWHYVGHWIPPTYIHAERADACTQVWRIEMPSDLDRTADQDE